jgi:DNA-3-methyladenine glycosylase I
MSYCEFCLNQPLDSIHRIYHDTQYGFLIQNDNELFERLVLEINQAGLSWDIILKKVDNFRRAYDDFNIEKVAAYNEQDFLRLMNDAGIVRNRLKINAAIVNANRIIGIQQQDGSFKNWLDKHRHYTKTEWTKLFKKTFVFTGGEIVNEFLMSTGYLDGAHQTDCPIRQKCDNALHKKSPISEAIE